MRVISRVARRAANLCCDGERWSDPCAAAAQVPFAGSRHSLDGSRGDRVKQPAAAVGDRVKDHLGLAPGPRQAGCTEQSGVVGDELVRALAHPREIAHAQLAAVA